MNKLLLKKLNLLLVLSTVAFFIACEDIQDNEPKLTTQAFVNEAAANNIFKIIMGNMAMASGNRNSIKSFGQKITDEHTILNAELKTLATRKNLNFPTSIPQDKTEKIMQLQGATSNLFDREFAPLQVEAYQEAVDLYEKAYKDIADAEVQKFIQKTLPILRLHLEQANDIEATIN